MFRSILASLFFLGLTLSAAAQGFDAEGKKYARMIGGKEHYLFDKSGFQKFLVRQSRASSSQVPLWARISPVILPVVFDGGCATSIFSKEDGNAIKQRYNQARHGFIKAFLPHADFREKEIVVALSWKSDVRKRAVAELDQAIADCQDIANDAERPVFLLRGLIRQDEKQSGCDLPGIPKCRGIKRSYGPTYFTMRGAVFSGLTAADFDEDGFDVWETDIFEQMVDLGVFTAAE